MPWPIIKIGATKGQPRSRNKTNGRIRKTRSDRGKKRK